MENYVTSHSIKMKLVSILALFSFIFTLQWNAKKKNTSKNHLEEWTVLKTGKFAPAGQSRYQSTEGFFLCLFVFFVLPPRVSSISFRRTTRKINPRLQNLARVRVFCPVLCLLRKLETTPSLPSLKTRDSATNWSRIPNSLSPKHRASNLKSLRRRIQNPKPPWIAGYFSNVAKENSEKTEWSKQWVEPTTFRLVVRKPRLSVHESSLRRRRP